jgi:hypothetical protein
MKKYVGVKIVKAEPMNYHAAGKAGLIRNFEESIEDCEGYKVIYKDGYESWSPKDTFEESYKALEDYFTEDCEVPSESEDIKYGCGEC